MPAKVGVGFSAKAGTVHSTALLCSYIGIGLNNNVNKGKKSYLSWPQFGKHQLKSPPRSGNTRRKSRTHTKYAKITRDRSKDTRNHTNGNDHNCVHEGQTADQGPTPGPGPEPGQGTRTRTRTTRRRPELSGSSGVFFRNKQLDLPQERVFTGSSTSYFCFLLA